MKKVLLLIALGAALTSCEGELEKVMEQVVEMKEETNKEGTTKTDKVEDVNLRIFKDRTQTGKERPQ